MNSHTIAAISTPSGEGGIGVIRISGKQAISVADKVFASVNGKTLQDAKGYTALYGKVKGEKGDIDEAVALVFRAPKSYTGEDVVELSVHGGSYVLKETLRAVLVAGAKPAERGEFTRRAFLNGKLDLIEAEAVMGIISANGEKTQRAALSLREGAASKQVEKIKANLLTAAAGLAVYSDYPDDELPEFSNETLENALSSAKDELYNMLKNYDTGKILREGVNAVIAGRPNVGKSTLMNALAGCRRSIVTSIAGTTRDVVEETVMLGDIKLNLSDTAGLRETDDEIEKIGVGISRNKIETAGLIIAVFDGSVKANDEDLNLIELCRNRPAIAVLNKSDLQFNFDKSLLKDIPTATISAEDTSCVDELSRLVAEVCGTHMLDGSETLLCSERQRNCCASAKDFVAEALSLLKSGVTLDAVSVAIDDALTELLSLTGERVTNAVVDEVFSKFCVGK